MTCPGASLLVLLLELLLVQSVVSGTAPGSVMTALMKQAIMITAKV